MIKIQCILLSVLCIISPMYGMQRLSEVGKTLERCTVLAASCVGFACPMFAWEYLDKYEHSGFNTYSCMLMSSALAIGFFSLTFTHQYLLEENFEQEPAPLHRMKISCTKNYEKFLRKKSRTL